MEYIDIVNLGKELGYEGSDLHSFIQERQAEECKRRQQIEQREDREREREREYREREYRQEEAKREHELKMAEIQLEQARVEAASGRNTHNRGSGLNFKMPYFDEKTDEMDGYLRLFERVCQSYGLDRDQWSIRLASCLTGKGKDVFKCMPDDDTGDYDKLKKALLDRYRLTEDEFKKRFFGSRLKDSETITEFSTRLSYYLDNWVNLSGADKTYEGLRDLFIREQCLFNCNKDVTMFVKEKAPSSLEEVLKAAEHYMRAHNLYKDGSREKRRPDNMFNASRAHKGIEKERETGAGSQQGREEKARNEAISRGNFGKYDHKRVSAQSQYNRVDSHNSQDHKCFNCGSSRHFAKDCRHRPKMAAALELLQGGEDSDSDSVISGELNEISANSNEDSDVACACFELPKPVNITCDHGKNMKLHVASAAVESKIDCNFGNRFLISKGQVGQTIVDVMRDTGCSCVVVAKQLVTGKQLTGKFKPCRLIDSSIKYFPVADIYIDTLYFTGNVEALVVPNPVYPLVIGNIKGTKGLIEHESVIIQDDEESLCEEMETKLKAELADSETAAAVQTRSQIGKGKKPIKPLKVVKPVELDVDRDKLIQLQKNDVTLKKCLTWAESGEILKSGKSNSATFFMQNSLLKRKYSSNSVNMGDPITQIVVPKELRQRILRIAHDGIMSGHLGVSKTRDRIGLHFYWPGMFLDIDRYCKSCDICQRTIPKGKVGKVPLGSMPLIGIPFSRVALDLVGPLPVTTQGFRYILTIVDYASRYPEAVALKNKETETVAEGLLSVYSRTGIPDEVLHDQGSEFMSNVMKEVNRLLSIKQMNTTPYHPMCNGLNEKFNGTLKSMLRKMCSEMPKEWDRYLNPLLFAYRECPQESTGFAPFELLYGRSVRGPMAILHDLWAGEVGNDDVQTTYEYVFKLRQRLEETCKMANEALRKSSVRYKINFNKGKKDRSFKVGEKVLLLLPTDGNKLLMQWKGPHDVVAKKGYNDYVIKLPHGEKTFHANLLKKYISQDPTTIIPRNRSDVRDIVATAVVEEDSDTEEQEREFVQHVSNDCLPTFSPLQTESYKDVHINPNLTKEQRAEVMLLLEQYNDVLTDVPKTTHIIEHEVNLTTDEPVKCKSYKIPFAKREVIKEEINKMLELGVVERSSAPYAAPIVLVAKKDGSIRFCTNYSQLNKVTIFDCEPMPSPEYIFSKVSTSKFFTKIDLSKGYWQVPVREVDRDKTSFITPDGLYRYLKMPFGMVNSSSTFNKLIKKILNNLEDVDSYVDDILGYTMSWVKHVEMLKNVLQRLRDANLSARPSKCFVGYTQIDFLGHRIGEGILQPEKDKIKKIEDSPRPVTKKQLRSFLGLVGFYRKFISNFASISAVLTDMCKQGRPNKLEWGEKAYSAFQTLRSYLTRQPILRLPNFDSTFIVQTDAADSGIGAVLLQESAGMLFPIYYMLVVSYSPEKPDIAPSRRSAWLLCGPLTNFRYICMVSHLYFRLITSHWLIYKGQE